MFWSIKKNRKETENKITNFEKYKEDILRIVTESHNNPAKRDGVVASCVGLSCGECDFGSAGDCARGRFKWLYEDDGEEPDGCDGCKYEYKREDESPCTECCNNYTSKWKRKPKKTRQDEFLEIYPNAMMLNGVIDICPKHVDGNCARCRIYAKRPCIDCHKDYWLQEMEE